MSSALKKQARYTYGDYLTWPDSVRGELIHGVFYDMTPAPNTAHQSLLAGLVQQVLTQLQGKSCRGYFAPFDVRLPQKNEADEWVDTVVQPDLLVVCDRKKIDEQGCRGAPDWIVEVLSPRTAQKDHALKRDLYQKHGVREFWLVHPIDRVVTVYTLTRSGRFGAANILPATGKLAVSVLPGLKINWELVFAE